jgi:hypothetical protein
MRAIMALGEQYDLACKGTSMGEVGSRNIYPTLKVTDFEIQQGLTICRTDLGTNPGTV